MLVRGYVRLSRADAKKGDTVANHVEILQYLAKQNGLATDENPLPLESIVTEIESGGKLDTREGLQRILQECRAKAITHLLVYDVARLSRGQESDWGEIKKALHAGRVTLVTPRSAFLFDDQLDTTLLDIEAVLARRYRHEYGLRRKAHNESRTRKGVRSAAWAPYGYAWHSTEKRYTIVPEQYEVVCEIYRRAWHEGAKVIAMSLSERYKRTGEPVPPGMAKGFSTSHWRPATVRQILTNPIYSGRPAMRYRQDRYGKLIILKRDEWIMPDAEQEFEHPIAPGEWEELQQMMQGRKWEKAAPNTTGYLRGVLFCSAGKLMHPIGKTSYQCHCATKLEAHSGSTLAQPKAHAVVEWYLRELFAAMKPGVLPLLEKADMPTLRRELHAAMIQAETAKRLSRDMMANVQMLKDAFGEGAVQERLADAARTQREAESRLAAAQSAIESASTQIPTDTIALVRRLGFEKVWASMTYEERRDTSRDCIAAIHVQQGDRPKAHVRRVVVVPRDWAKPFHPGGGYETLHWRVAKRLQAENGP